MIERESLFGTLVMPVTAYVIASDAPLLVKANGGVLFAEGHAVWLCDGVADDVKIQAALDALASGGGRVVLSEGTFTLSSSLDITDYDSISGAGRGTVVVADGDYPVFSAVGTDGNLVEEFSIFNMTVKGSGKANTSCDGVYVEFGNHFWLENLYFTKLYAAFHFKGCHCPFINSFYVLGTGSDQSNYGFLTDWQSSSRMNEINAVNGLIGDVALNGVRLKGASGVLMSNILVVNSAQEGWYIGDESAGQYSEYLHFVNCHADNPNLAAYPGWMFKQGSADRLRGIQLDNCWSGGHSIGMLLWGGVEYTINNFLGQNFLYEAIKSLSEKVSITGGVIRDWDRNDTGTYSGIKIEGAADNLVQGVTFINTNTGKYSIEESGAANHNIIKGNNYRNAQGVCVVGDKTVVDIVRESVELDLSDAAIDSITFVATAPSALVGYKIFYSEGSSADAGVDIRIGRIAAGSLDDDYFDITTSEASKALGNSTDILTADLAQTFIAEGDAITVGTAGGKTGAGKVIVSLKIVEMTD